MKHQIVSSQGLHQWKRAFSGSGCPDSWEIVRYFDQDESLFQWAWSYRRVPLLRGAIALAQPPQANSWTFTAGFRGALQIKMGSKGASLPANQWRLSENIHRLHEINCSEGEQKKRKLFFVSCIAFFNFFMLRSSRHISFSIAAYLHGLWAVEDHFFFLSEVRSQS